MSATNSFHVIGNLTRDAETKYTNTGTAICNFSIACNKKYKGNDGNLREEVSYFDATIFGKMAESIGQYLVKGKMVAIDGELKQERWEKDGQTHSKVKLIVDNLYLVSTGNREGGQGQDRGGYDREPARGGNSEGRQYDPPPRAESRSPAPATGRRAAPDDFDDDVPF